jgi:hypothetical protein
LTCTDEMMKDEWIKKTEEIVAEVKKWMNQDLPI